MKLKLFFLLTIVTAKSFSQGGWLKDTNPLNDVTTYTTIYNYVGASFVELNGDNYVDLLAAPKAVFLNNGDGTFSQTTSLPFTLSNGVSGSSSADLDNDGDNDVIVACVPTKVFFNNGSGVFADSTSKIPSFGLYGSWACAIGNYNNDSKLDFIFSHANGYHAPSTPSPCRFYKQQPTGFSPLSLSLSPVTTTLDSYTNPYWSDYDLDGDMDLFLASGPVMGTPDLDYCYKNMKIETGIDSLQPMTTELFATQAQDGQCYNFIDYDNDGDFDLCLTNYYSAPTRLYRNNGGIYVSVSTPFTNATTNIANCWGDYDNDGDLDAIITNDNQITRYYRNNGNGTFTYLPSGFNTPTATNGITNGDYDNDGDLDIFTNGLGNNGTTASTALFINDTVAGNRNSINIKYTGTLSNRSALGTIVKIKATIFGNTFWQMREINAQNSFQGQNDLRVHFGLGDAVTVDSMVIKWPAGGTEYYTNLIANSFYQITEGSGLINLAIEDKTLNHSAVTIFPNPADDVLNISVTGMRLENNTTLEIIDAQGRVVLKSRIQNLSFILPIQNLTQGLYFIKIQDANTPTKAKFIKK